MQRLVPILIALGLAACGGEERKPEEAFALGEREFRVNEQLVIAGQPSAARIAEIGAAGFDTVMNVNHVPPGFAEDEVVARAGMTYDALPITGEQIADAAQREKAYAWFAELESGGKKGWCHCSSGNRCAALWALYQAERKNRSPEDALQLGKQAGLTGLEPVVRKILGLPSKGD